jgi:hypothetical protein
MMKAVPTYPLASSVFCDAKCDDVWAFENNLSDIVVMFLHLLVWTSVLVMIEKNMCKCRLKKKIQTPIEFEDMDSDVENEATRIA